MAAFVDFAEVKARANIEQVAAMLSLQLRKSGAQLRGPCPACKSGGDRALVITPEKGVFYCFAAKIGGDQLALTAHIKNCSVKESASHIADTFGGRNGGTSAPVTVHRAPVPSTLPPAPPQLKALDYLEPEHASVQSLGISAQTASAWESGYAGKGIMRGRFACPVKSKDGALLAYVGMAVNPEQSPRFLLPSNFDGKGTVFGADRVTSGTLYLVRSPLDVLLAAENGAENVVSFLGDITALELQVLAALMDERRVDSLELF